MNATTALSDAPGRSGWLRRLTFGVWGRSGAPTASERHARTVWLILRDADSAVVCIRTVKWSLADSYYQGAVADVAAAGYGSVRLVPINVSPDEEDALVAEILRLLVFEPRELPVAREFHA